MNSRRERLWLQRQALVTRSTDLRERLTGHAQALEPVTRLVDRTWSAGQWVRQHPWVPTVLAVLWLWRKPRQVWRWGRRAWGAWRWIQRAMAVAGRG